VPTLTALAPAKVNLGLWVIRRRPDGYHDILTLFQAVDLCDRLTVEAAPRGLSMTCDDPALPVDDGNLVMRAARRLRSAARTRRGARFHLRKAIPAGSGLGGGSADAAATLVLLDRLWDLGLSRTHLARIGLEIGSDVPFFLTGGTAVGRGRGDRLTPVELAGSWIFLLVHGRVPIAAKRAYSQYKRELTASGPPPRIAALKRGERLRAQTIKEVDNQLEPGLLADFPDIGIRKAALLSLGAANALMTGSGSTVFGIFDRLDKAGRARAHLQRQGFPVDLGQSVSHGFEVKEQAGGSNQI